MAQSIQKGMMIIMKRKILAALLCLGLALSLTACSTGEPVSSALSSMAGESSMVSPSPAVSPSPNTSASPEASPEVSGDVSMAGAGGIESYAKAVKDTYGADYIPDRMLSDTEVTEKLGLSSDLYDEVYAEGSTLDENPDIFVAVKAKSGKAAEVEKILKDYKTKLSTDTAYTANVDKIKAAEIHTEGDHVFMFLLGANEFVDQGEDMAENFGNEVKKGVDAIKNMFR